MVTDHLQSLTCVEALYDDDPAEHSLRYEDIKSGLSIMATKYLWHHPEK